MVLERKTQMSQSKPDRTLDEKVKSIFQEWKLTIVVFCVVFLVAFLVRIINLTILPVFADEAIYIRWAQIMANEPTLRFLPLSDGKQPLFMWIVMVLVGIADDPLVIGRMVSVAAGLVSLGGVFVLSYLLFRSKCVSLVSSLLWAISPFSVFFDRMALVDGLVASLAVWIVIFAVLTVKYARLDMAMITGFLLGLAFLTKSPALFFLLLIPSALLFAKLPEGREKRLVHSIKLGLYVVVIWVIGFGMQNILRLGPNYHLIAQRNVDYVYPISHIISSSLDPFLPHFHRHLEWLWMMGPGFVLVFIFVGGVGNLKKNWREVLLLVLWSVGLVSASAMYAKVFTARYIFYTIPFYFILAASSFGLKKIRKYLYVVLFLFVVNAVWFDYLLLTNPEKAYLPRSERSGYLEEWTAGTGIAWVADYIKEEARNNPDRHIVVGTEGFFGTLPDGLQMYLEGVRNVTVIGVGLAIKDVHSSLVESYNSGNSTYLVVNSSRLDNVTPEQMGLEIVYSVKKAIRDTEFSREKALNGPQDTFYFLKVI